MTSLLPFVAIMLSLGLIIMGIGAANVILTFFAPRVARVLGGFLVFCLVFVTVVSCVYALSIPASHEPITDQCLGAPYERC